MPASLLIQSAHQLLNAKIPAALVRVIETKGSAPRDRGAMMLVTAEQTFDTIGGGQLEWIVSAKARDFIQSSEGFMEFVVSLGPEINQCCGGIITLRLDRLTQQIYQKLESSAENTLIPDIIIFGAGHTGRAIAQSISLLPFNTTIIDSRPNVFEGLPENITCINTPLPEEYVRSAKPNTAIISVTHAHHLDFLISAEALAKNQFAYVGMIGSKTKRSVFKTWMVQNDYDPKLIAGLTCPIGLKMCSDKRPAVIASLVAAELASILLTR